MPSETPDNQIPIPTTDKIVPRPPTFVERHNISPVGFAFISLAVVFVLYQIIGGSIIFAISGGKVQPGNVQLLRFATMAGQLLLILVPTIILTRLQSDDVWKGLRLRAIGSREILYAVIGVLALQQLLQVYLYAQDQIPIPPPIRPIVEGIKKTIEETYKGLVTARSVPELVYVLFVVALVPAICEEFLFRGLVQKNFETGLRGWWGVVVPGVIFGAYHFNPFSFVPLAILGIYFGFLVFRSGSVLVAVVAHFVNNFSAVLLVFFNADENLLLSDGKNTVSDPMLIFTLLGFGFLFLLSTFAFFKVTKEPPERTST